MAFQVVWSPNALEDLEAIARYISRDSVSYAGAVVRKISIPRAILNVFPAPVGLCLSLAQMIREVLAYSYRIVYRLEGETITVAAVIHGRRLFDST